MTLDPWSLSVLALCAVLVLLVAVLVWWFAPPRQDAPYWTGEDDTPRHPVTPLPPVYDWEKEQHHR